MSDAMLARASRPASSRKAVVFCCGMNYLPFAAIAAEQIATAHPDRDFDICIASDAALQLPDTLRPLGLRTVEIPTADEFNGLRLDARQTPAAYLRLALPEALSEDYDRLLYLDSDICYLHGDVSRLLDLDLKGKAVAAVRDSIQWRTPDHPPEQFRRFGWPAAPYFNSGLLLIDTRLFRDADLEARCIAFGRRKRDRLVGHDQTLLNCALRGEWSEFAPHWNWQVTWASQHFSPREDAAMLHFIGPRKPWSDRSGHATLAMRRILVEALARHFPDLGVAHVVSPLSDPGKQIKILAKHLISVRGISRYLRRFVVLSDVIPVDA